MTCDDEDTKFVIIIQVSVHFLVYQSCNGVNAPYDVSYCPDNRERHSKGPSPNFFSRFSNWKEGFIIVITCISRRELAQSLEEIATRKIKKILLG